MPEVIPSSHRYPEVDFGMALSIDLEVQAILARFQKEIRLIASMASLSFCPSICNEPN
jgi:hypothetical protein